MNSGLWLEVNHAVATTLVARYTPSLGQKFGSFRNPVFGICNQATPSAKMRETGLTGQLANLIPKDHV